MRNCHACQKEIPGVLKIAYRDACPSCGADLRCCFNCLLYDRAVSKQCRETLSELVREKEKANFCEYFVFAEKRIAAQETIGEQTRKTLDDLFKK